MFCVRGAFGLQGVLPRLFTNFRVTQLQTCNFSLSQDSQEATPKEAPLDKLYKRIEVEVRGNDPAVLKSYGQFSVTAASHLGITVGRNVTLPKPTHERITVLKSIHIYKKHRVQYETRTYFRYMDFLRLTGSTADTFLEYIQRNLPEGVAMKVTKVELHRLPESIRSSPSEL
ncbi:28S ribosomal protein S10, mitochondrial [Orussus abietinus]|uniref:28S ribosomal protein S10, mitochondrial n=1 Tax=Orussus abietinus TaxID=222816 RepID=UPI0006267821|nr:28S ribosomal protein S10, mitochondrial [Orussus abietinus]